MFARIGIIRCDMIAESVIAAAKHVGEVPIVVRLQGTNSEQGQAMVGLFNSPAGEESSYSMRS